MVRGGDVGACRIPGVAKKTTVESSQNTCPFISLNFCFCLFRHHFYYGNYFKSLEIIAWVPRATSQPLFSTLEENGLINVSIKQISPIHDFFRDHNRMHESVAACEFVAF